MRTLESCLLAPAWACLCMVLVLASTEVASIYVFLDSFKTFYGILRVRC
jgi:hypothetical protein